MATNYPTDREEFQNEINGLEKENQSLSRDLREAQEYGERVYAELQSILRRHGLPEEALVHPLDHGR